MNSLIISTVSVGITILLIIYSAIFLFAEQNAYSEQKSYFADLSGKTLEPAVKTNASGLAKLEYNPQANIITYELNLMEIDKIIGAHIHKGDFRSTENGPILIWLNVSQLNDNAHSRISLKGEITKSDLTGPLEGKQLLDLINAIANGETYIVIHTIDYEFGEIRGKIIAKS